MDKLRQAAQQALEALEWNYNTDLDNIPACEQWAKMLKETITALRAALLTDVTPAQMAHADAVAEPEQPVAWQWLDTANFRKKIPADATPEHWRPLYTAPTPQRKPLTDEELRECWDQVRNNETVWGMRVQFARAIERAHGIGEQHE